MAPGGRRRVFATFAAAAIALMQVSPQLMILDGYCTGVGVVGFRRRRRGRSEGSGVFGMRFWSCLGSRACITVSWDLSCYYFLHGCMRYMQFWLERFVPAILVIGAEYPVLDFTIALWLF